MINGFRVMGQQQAPGLEWTRSYWPDEDILGNHVVRSESGEDWFYDIAISKNVITNVPNGVICAGYQRDKCIATPGSDCETYFNNDKLEHYCLMRDKNHVAYKGFGTLWFGDFNGEMKWYKAYGKGNPEWLEFITVTQANDGNYLVGGQGIADNKLLNPIVGGSPFQTTNNLQGLTGYIAKIDAITHNIIWEYYYNMFDPATTAVPWQNYGGSIYSIVEDPGTANIVAVGGMSGFNSINNNLDKSRVGVFYLNANGQIINRALISEFSGVFPLAAGGLGIIKSAVTANRYYICGSAQSATSASNELGYLIKLDINIANANPFTYSTKLVGNPSFARNIIFDIKEMANGHIAVPCAEEGLPNYGPFGKFKLYDFEPNNLYSNFITDMGSLYAYDNRFGIEKTQDGGFIIINTRSNSATSNNITNVSTSDNLAELQFGPSFNNSFVGINTANNKEKYTCGNDYWNTSPVFTKFDANLTQQWQKQFPFNKYDNNTTNQGDVTRHECVYQVVQTPDGGYIGCGNTSQNLDDHYLIKVNGDCGNQINYDYGFGTTTYGITTWNTNKKIKGELVIANGGHLIIDGATIEFADTRQVDEPTRIIIKKGGKLTLKNGAKLTSVSCPNAMWDGIEIQGSNGDEQTLTGAINTTTGFGGTSTNQGYLEIDNATIEKARYAIANTRMIYDNEKDFEYKPDGSMQGAGIVQAYQCKFIDNWRDADLQGYISPTNVSNKNAFNQCNFISTGAMPIKGFMQNDEHEGEFVGKRAYIYLNGIEGVKLQTCTFENNSIDDKHKRGTAVESIDAPFYMASNTIKNLFMATNASCTHPCAQAMIISETNVANVKHGFGFSGYTMPRPIVTYNTIALDQAKYSDEEDNQPPWGLFVTGCDGYTIEENSITNFNNTTDNPGLGAIINNRHEYNTRLFRNTTSNTNYGIFVAGKNGVPAVDKGLAIQCNTNTTLNSDIAVLSHPWFGQGVIKLNQGKCTGNIKDAANNRFYGTVTNVDLIGNVSPFNYSQYNKPEYVPAVFGSLMTDINCGNPPGGATHLEFCPINSLPIGNYLWLKDIETGEWEKSYALLNTAQTDIGNNILAGNTVLLAQNRALLATYETSFYNMCYKATNGGLPKVIAYLVAKTNKETEDYLLLAKTYCTNKQFNEATSILNNLPTSSEDIEVQKNVLTTFISLSMANKKWMQAPSSFIADCKASSNNYLLLANEYKSNIHHILQNTPVTYYIPNLTNNARLANIAKPALPIMADDDIAIKLYPNPTSNQFTLEANQVFSADMPIHVMDVSGRIVYTTLLQKGEKKKLILITIKAGLYFVSINNGVHKLIIQ